MDPSNLEKEKTMVTVQIQEAKLKPTINWAKITPKKGWNPTIH